MVLLGRRRLLALLGGAGALVVMTACGSKSKSTAASSTSPSSTATTGATATTTTTGSAVSNSSAAPASAGTEIPDETAGPFPGDGTNGPNVLTESGVVRNDIRTGFGSSSTTAEGIAVTIDLTVVDADTGAPLSGAAVYLWHCDRDGDYSLYSDGKTGENYLRGVQVADDNGHLNFVSIFPGCYSGRWPHAHFEVYTSIEDATNGRQAIKTSQLAMPESVCSEAYAATGYESSARNFAGSSLARDMVFSDGVDDQLVTVTGNPNDGYIAALVVRV